MLPLLLDLSLKATILLVVASAGAVMLRTASAATRNLIWSTTLTGLLVLPVLCFVLPAWHILPRWLDIVRPSAGTSSPMSSVAEKPADVVPPASQVRADVSPQALPASRWPSVAKGFGNLIHQRSPVQELLVFLYCVGFVAVLVPAVMAFLLLFRTSRDIRRAPAIVPIHLWHQVCQSLRVTCAVSVLQSPERVMPMAWGLYRAIILLPNDAGAWSDERLRCVLLHELAHIKRRDALFLLLARVACAVYWFHPLVWFAAARVRSTAELACDDMVLAAGTRSSDYAEHLLALGQGLYREVGLESSAAIAMARSGRESQLYWRVRAIFDKQRQRRSPTRSAVCLLFLGLMALLLPLACMQPRREGATVRSGDIDLGATAPAPSHPQTYEFRDPTTGALEFELKGDALEAIKDALGKPLPGRAVAKRFVATYYLSNRRVAELRAEKFIMEFVPGPVVGRFTTTRLSRGTVSGSVILTISGEPSAYALNGRDPMQDAVKISFDGDLELDVAKATLTGSGRFHVQANNMEVDGRGLEVTADRKLRMLEAATANGAIQAAINKAIHSH